MHEWSGYRADAAAVIVLSSGLLQMAVFFLCCTRFCGTMIGETLHAARFCSGLLGMYYPSVHVFENVEGIWA